MGRGRWSPFSARPTSFSCTFEQATLYQQLLINNFFRDRTGTSLTSLGHSVTLSAFFSRFFFFPMIPMHRTSAPLYTMEQYAPTCNFFHLFPLTSPSPSPFPIPSPHDATTLHDQSPLMGLPPHPPHAYSLFHAVLQRTEAPNGPALYLLRYPTLQQAGSFFIVLYVRIFRSSNSGPFPCSSSLADYFSCRTAPCSPSPLSSLLSPPELNSVYVPLLLLVLLSPPTRWFFSAELNLDVCTCPLRRALPHPYRMWWLMQDRIPSNRRGRDCELLAGHKKREADGTHAGTLSFGRKEGRKEGRAEARSPIPRFLVSRVGVPTPRILFLGQLPIGHDTQAGQALRPRDSACA